MIPKNKIISFLSRSNMNATLFTSLFLSVAVFTAIEAIPCSAVPANLVVNDNVDADGGACILRNVIVYGNVTVYNNAVLTTLDGTTIDGNIKAEGFCAIQLLPGTSVQRVDANTGGPIRVEGSFISSSLLVQYTFGGLTICGSRIQDVIYYSGSDGPFRLEYGPFCRQNSISKDIIIQKGSGSVSIDGNDIGGNGKVSIIERGGQVSIRNAKLYQLSVEKVNDKVYLGNVNVDDALITANTGGVDITNGDFNKLHCVGNSPNPTCSGNTVALAPVSALVAEHTVRLGFHLNSKKQN